jgi:hypothetical protein
MDFDIEMRKAFEDCGDVFLVTANAVKSFGHDPLKSPFLPIIKQGSDARSIDDRSTAYGGVGIDLADSAARLLNVLAAEAHLIFDGIGALKV